MKPRGRLSLKPSRFLLVTIAMFSSCSSDELTMQVDPPTVSILSFEAQPANIQLGQTTVLSWRTEGTRSVIIEPNIGIQSAEGNYTVKPVATTTYTLRIETKNGPVRSDIRVEVLGGPPKIDLFSASPQAIMAGGSTTLQWKTSNTTRTVITPDLGESPTDGSVVVSPETTTTYKLIAMSDTEMVSQELTVTVGNGAAPIIHSFTLSPLTVAPGQSATLSWQTSNANTVSLDNNLGAQLPATGTMQVNPIQTTTYTLTAMGFSESVSAEVTVTVQEGGLIIVSLSAQPASVTEGQSTTISWEITGATEVNFDQGIGRKATTGSVQVAPMQSTTYTMTAIGSGGQAMRTVIVNVSPLGVFMVDSFTVSLSTVGPGETATLFWRTTGADTVTIDGGVGSQATIGQVVINLSVMTTYTLQAQNTAGISNGMVIVTVMTIMIGEICADAISIVGVGGTYQGTTLGMNNDYESPRMCTGYSQLGPDLVYKASLTAGHLMTAFADFEMSLDGSLYTVTDCSDLTSSCVAGSDSGFSGARESIRHVAQQTGDHFLVVDAAVNTFSGTHDLSVSFFSAETCASAAPLLTDGSAEWYTTDGYSNDYNLTSNACTGYSANASDRVYEVQLQAGDQLQVSVAPNPVYDPSVYVVSDCSNVDTYCIGGSDKPRGDTETVNPVVPQAGTYYVIIDGYITNGSGSGEITASIAHGDTCADAYRVNKGTSQFKGTTDGYGTDYGTTSASGSCTNWSQAGPDAVYKIELDNNETLTASLDPTGMGTPWDGSLYLITDCAQSASTCVAGQDNGNPETITYQNTSGQAATYYLMVDSFLASRSGEYTLDVTIN